MSLPQYHTLQQQSDVDNTKLGVTLPRLHAGVLHIAQSMLSFDDVCSQIHAFSPQQGWVMYRDSVTSTTQIPSRDDLIEAEYCHDNDSLQVRLVGPNRYSVCAMTHQASDASHTVSMVYQHVSLIGDVRLGDHQYVQYRLWYQQQTDHVQQGRWIPLAQQFIGFAPKEEK
ncbi:MULTISPECIES: hypothetical protein [unclassified Salinivibrio]|uniref:hypothetical protein n=1 Tax=unclassified Salinivibrio TaxID=2636825 RepID=UPI0009C4796F|nr:MULTISPECIES: hypothetical protein [unclassified Salinivibrio]OOF09526.1 hypothetical protein BZG83_14920 [Salinivibrio sp. PR919]OOF17852.1 hypothetical protein BZG84_06000 [Salinivibrio sp. PR932]